MNFARECHDLIEDYYSIHNRETAVVREVGESPNDRNDRGTNTLIPRTYHFLTQISSYPCRNRLVQHAHIPYAPTNPRAAKANVTDSCTVDRRRR